MKNEIKHTTHSTYRCQYHIVFAPKYRRKAIYGQLKADIGQILRKLCEQKGVEIIEATAMTDHIHMLVSIPPYLSIAQFMGYLKGKSTLMIFDRHANLKYKYGSRHFWCRGYYVDTVGRNEKVIREYIKCNVKPSVPTLVGEPVFAPFRGCANHHFSGGYDLFPQPSRPLRRMAPKILSLKPWSFRSISARNSLVVWRFV